MIHVEEYKETINYISNSYSYVDPTPNHEFLDEEDVTVRLVVSGLSREKAKELKQYLDIMGISKPMRTQS